MKTIIFALILLSTTAFCAPLIGHYEIRNVNGKCLDVSEASPNDGANIQLFECNKTLAQKFNSHWNTGHYLFLNMASQKHIDVSWGGNGTNIQQWDSEGISAKWVVTPLASNPDIYTLESVSNPGYCMDVEGNSNHNGANIQRYLCNGTDAQKFIFVESSSSETMPTTAITITNKHSGKVVDAAGGVIAENTNIQQYHYNGTDAQHWILSGRYGNYHIDNVSAPFALNADFYPTSSVSNVYLAPNTPTPWWLFFETNTGEYIIQDAHSHKCLEVEWAQEWDTANIQTSHCNGGNAQTWIVQ